MRGGVVGSAAALHVVPRAAMPAATAMQRKAIGMVVVPVRALLALLVSLRLRRLPAGDEGGQPIDIAVAALMRA